MNFVSYFVKILENITPFKDDKPKVAENSPFKASSVLVAKAKLIENRYHFIIGFAMHKSILILHISTKPLNIPKCVLSCLFNSIFLALIFNYKTNMFFRTL